MKRTASRLVYTVIVLFVSSIAVFYAIRLSGGDATAAALPGSATEEFREEFRDRLGLNEPIYQQYFTYMGRILSGDPGNSLTNNKALTDMLTEHGRNSLVLGGTAFGLVFLVGIPLGILASLRRNSWADQGIMSFSTVAMAVPNFWLALLAVWLFASTLGWLPSAGCCGTKQLILPAVVLAFEGIALTVRLTRSSMIESQNSDYVRTLRAGGLSEWRITCKHVLRNALIPIISLAGLRIGQIVGYALIVETIFGWPGLGQVLVNAVLRRDYPVAQFFSLVLVALVVLGNWLADTGYTIANPRLRKST
jgi:peptide/nickel transport system permease protein